MTRMGGVPFLGGLSTWSSISPLAFHPSLASLHAYRHAPDDHCHAKIAQNLNSHSVATPPSFPCAQETYKMPGKGLSNSWDLDLSLTRQELNKVVHVENNMFFQQPRLDEALLAAAASQQPSCCCTIAPSCSSQCSSSTSTSTQPSSAQTMWRINKLDESRRNSPAPCSAYCLSVERRTHTAYLCRYVLVTDDVLSESHSSLRSVSLC